MIYEVNPISPDFRKEMAEITKTVSWKDPSLARIERFRLLTDPGFPFYDVSYVVGRLTNGELVNVQVPFGQLPKRTWKTELVNIAKASGVHAKNLGFFDALSTLS